MFKKFSPSTDVSGQTNVKSSVQRQIRQQLLNEWKIDAETLEQIWPKKESLVHVKCKDAFISIYTLHGEPLFFQMKGKPFCPTLRLLHKYPSILPPVRVDRGAIKFLLGGANMMCPGFTSKGGQLPPPQEAIPADSAVAIYAEGKEHPAAVGFTMMDTEAIKKVNKGPGVEVTTYLGDDLWAAHKI